MQDGPMQVYTQMQGHWPLGELPLGMQLTATWEPWTVSPSTKAPVPGLYSHHTRIEAPNRFRPILYSPTLSPFILRPIIFAGRSHIRVL